ncbi:glycine/D-amino acid oxidase-like deaminating enzyme [Hoeflea marina]|uniref:Glycine/D-amino acid oxidase-like deaminating enzyme n=1 Tax=Hoeflea marina TaxID=274592 RepID=A0A317PLW9_9HYPH|nr:FAD-binding oxidoreductase [Hoeflea marina]PWW01922.1 glycine/D-amino acid oxidase-like deaminating enzyme [Hoeflea marina]
MGIRASIRPPLLPGDGQKSGWNAILEDRPTSPLQGNHTAEWVVVGAGFTGISCARRLAELRPNDRIILVDALPLGFGASGRNSGVVTESLAPEGGIKGLSLDRARQKTRLMNAGTEMLRRLTRQHAIACDWSDKPRIKASTNPVGESYLRGLKEGYEKVGTQVDWVSKEEVRHQLGTDFYGSGIAIHGNGIVQPAALLRGLADALPGNVILADASPVIEMSSEAPFRVTLPAATITCEKVMLCSNIFLPQFGFGRGRYMFLATHASLTEPMSAEQAAGFPVNEPFSLVPAIHGAASLRRTADNRILMRKSTNYAQPDLRFDGEALSEVRKAHRKAIDDRWPALRELPIAHTWGGIVSYPANHGQMFGKFGPGLYASSSCCGIGVSLGTISGTLLADLACGEGSELLDLVQAVPAPTPMPPEPFRRYIAEKALRNSTRKCQPD